MQRLALLFLCSLLAACGMKGELYEPAPPAVPAETTETPPPPISPEDAAIEPDKGERKTIPSTPDPAKSL